MSENALELDLRDRYDVPDAVSLQADRARVLAWLPGCESAVRRVAADPDALPISELGGRSVLARIESGGGPVLARPYRKGGALRLLRGGRFHGPLRPIIELVLHRRLQAEGVPVPDAVGAVVLRGAFGWRGFLLTREVAGALDLEAFLYGVAPPTGLPPSGVLRRAGRAVRALHDAGVAHADLHPKNLLIAPDGTLLVIDLDRARSVGALSDEDRLSNLVRLGRSIEKHRLKGLRVGRRSALRFLEGYAGDRRAAGEWLERIRSSLRRGLALRRLLWRLRGEARPWARPGTPAGSGPAAVPEAGA